MGDQTQDMIVWLRPEQAPLIRRACEAANVAIVGAGGPGRLGPAAATALQSEHVGDLRAALTSARTRAFLLADADDLGRVTDRAGAEAVQAAHARGVQILSLEPVPPTAMDLAGGRWRTTTNGLAPMQLVRFAPAVRRAQSLGPVEELLADFGRIRGASLTLLGPAVAGSMLARVFDALELVNRLFGEPESIDAVHTPADAGAPVYTAPGTSLEGLDGVVRALVRTQDGRPILLHAGVTAGAHARILELEGPAGTLRIADEGISWFAPDGSMTFESSAPALDDAAERDIEASHLAAAMRHALDTASLPPVEMASALAAAQAVVLSVRTGQPESPSTVRRMVGLT